MQDAAALVRVAPSPTESRKPNASGAGLDKDPEWQMVGFCPKNKAGTHPARIYAGVHGVHGEDPGFGEYVGQAQGPRERMWGRPTESDAEVKQILQNGCGFIECNEVKAAASSFHINISWPFVCKLESKELYDQDAYVHSTARLMDFAKLHSYCWQFRSWNNVG